MVTNENGIKLKRSKAKQIKKSIDGEKSEANGKAKSIKANMPESSENE